MPSTPKLPGLTPEMLLSPAAQREFRAALEAQGAPPRHTHVVQPRQQQPSPAAREAVDDWAETLAELQLGVGQSSGDPEISFAAIDEPIEFVRPLEEVRERARFRIDRPPPTRHFNPEHVPGPQGRPMEEVGRTGRFAILAEQPLDHERQLLASTHRQPPPTQPEKPVDRSKIRTVMERIVLDEDDEEDI